MNGDFLNFFMWIGGIAATGVFGLIGWVLKMIFSTLKEHRDNHDNLSRSLTGHKLHAAETFATKQDVRDGFDRVMVKLDKIDEKLDTKEDKK